MTAIQFLHLGSGMAISTFTFLGFGLTPDCIITPPKKEMLVHENRHLPLFSFRLAYLQIFGIFLSIASCSLSTSPNLAIRMSFAMPNTFGSPLEQLIYFSMKHISCQCHTKWQLYASVPTKRTRESCKV